MKICAKKLRKFSREFFKILEAQNANSCRLVDKDLLHLSTNLSQFGCWLTRDSTCECFLMKSFPGDVAGFPGCLHGTFQSEVVSKRAKYPWKNSKRANQERKPSFKRPFNLKWSPNGQKFQGETPSERIKRESRLSGFQVLCFFRDRGCCERWDYSIN